MEQNYFILYIKILILILRCFYFFLLLLFCRLFTFLTQFFFITGKIKLFLFWSLFLIITCFFTFFTRCHFLENFCIIYSKLIQWIYISIQTKRLRWIIIFKFSYYRIGVIWRNHANKIWSFLNNYLSTFLWITKKLN